MSPPAASTIPLQMLVGAVVVLALTAAANGSTGGGITSCTTPCPFETCPSGCPVTSCPLIFYEGGDAVHLFNGACVSWAKDFDNSIDAFHPGATPFVANTDTLQWQWAAPGARALGVAKAGILKEPADEFTLTVADDGNSGDTWAAVYEFGDGSKVHGEYKVPFTQAFTAQLKGMWFVVVRNWAAIPVVNGAQWNPGSFTATLRCAGGHAFLQDANTGSISCPARVAEGKCQYDALGFNPFERWNVFSLTGSSTLSQTVVEGRFASASTGSVTFQASNVHPVAEPWISAADSKWSVSSVGKVIKFSGFVWNGGVETKSSLDDDAANVQGDVATDQATLSVDLAVAAEYFNSRSRAWKGRANSFIDSASKDGTLTVRLHGKVNFLNVKGDELLKTPNIVLTGQPLGTLIINVDVNAKFSIDGKSPLTVVVVSADGKDVAPPAFGRVLFNFFNCPQLELDSLNQELHASILAPQARAFLTKVQGIRGNVIVARFPSTASTVFKLGPFGTLPAKLLPPANPKPTPKKWTATGKHAVACLWHEL